MRITQGRLKGRKLLSPPAAITRPTKSMVKEAFFNIVRNEVENGLFLDLFAGSGSLGIEAHSLGASAVFVENHPSALKILKQNLSVLGVLKDVELFPLDVFRALDLFSKKKRFFSVIFADPPYEKTKGATGIFLDQALLEAIDSKAALLDAGGVLVVESKRSLEPIFLHALLFKEARKYGDSYLNFFSKKL